MSVLTTASVIQYNGDAVSTVFSFPYYFLSTSDLTVKLSGVTKVLGADYTVAGAKNPAGGSVTFIVPPPVGVLNVEIRRLLPVTQPLDLVDNETVLEGTIDDALDRGAMISQQLAQSDTDILTLIAANYASLVAAINAIILGGGGAVPLPGASFATKSLVALSSTTWGWAQTVAAGISDSTSFGRALLTAATVAAQRTALGLQAIATYATATVAELAAGTASRAIDAALVRSAGTPIVVTPSAGAGAIDFNTGFNFAIAALTQNTTITLSNAASNLGKSGVIEVPQNATGGWTLIITGVKTDTAFGLGYATGVSAKNALSYYITSAGDVVIGTYARGYA